MAIPAGDVPAGIRGSKVFTQVIFFHVNFRMYMYANKLRKWLIFPNVSTVEYLHYEYFSVLKITRYTVHVMAMISIHV